MVPFENTKQWMVGSLGTCPVMFQVCGMTLESPSCVHTERGLHQKREGVRWRIQWCFEACVWQVLAHITAFLHPLNLPWPAPQRRGVDPRTHSTCRPCLRLGGQQMQTFLRCTTGLPFSRLSPCRTLVNIWHEDVLGVGKQWSTVIE